MATRVVSAVTAASNEPVLTGLLLYVLTRGPPTVRERLLRPFQNNILSKNGAARLSTFVTVLKLLTAAGILRRASRALNRLALNNWSLGRPGAHFKFGPGKEEIVVVTGGSSGFGYEMVKGFSKVARVVAIDITPLPSELAQLKDVYFYRCDVTDIDAVEAVCEEIRQTHGNPSVLVNNAGIAFGKTILEGNNRDTEKLFKVNIISHFVLIREFLPGMLKMRKGHVVTIASMASFFAAPGLLDYCCSKIGALYINDGLRAECLSRYEGGEGICTTSVHPSWHATAILKGHEANLRKAGINPDPASNVSDLIIEQVMAARSGRICVPKSEESKTGMRNWPIWAQDLAFGLLSKQTTRIL